MVLRLRFSQVKIILLNGTTIEVQIALQIGFHLRTRSSNHLTGLAKGTVRQDSTA